MLLPSVHVLLLSDRAATLILSLFSSAVNFFACYKLLTTWFSVRWAWASTEESEWEGLSWKLDTMKALGAIVCAYFFVGGVASVVGLIGVIKRRTTNVRLFRDYSIADLAFGFTSTAAFAFISSKPVVRSMMCEELSRQPDLLRTLSDSAGLNVENCESFLDKAIVSVLVALSVLLFIRLQFTLTVMNYYTHLRRSSMSSSAEHGHHHHRHHRSASASTTGSRRSRSHSRSNSQPILLLTRPLSSLGEKQSPNDTIVYAPVRLSAEQARSMDVRQAFVTLPMIREENRSRSSDSEGKIRLPIKEGEGLDNLV
ncbi:hypothetical protein FRC01_007804 [Tulasnella sp. 417]|nr:hypothetical protein FRC01_007804 [Tulasnella sp. 417]